MQGNSESPYAEFNIIKIKEKVWNGMTSLTNDSISIHMCILLQWITVNIFHIAVYMCLSLSRSQSLLNYGSLSGK